MCEVMQIFRNEGPCIQDFTVLQNSYNKMNVIHLILSRAHKEKMLNAFSGRKKKLKSSIDALESPQAIRTWFSCFCSVVYC